MCGLIYSASFKGKPVNNQIKQQYHLQKSRGRKGFGVFDGDFSHLIRKTGEDDILKWLDKYKSSDILFHHRQPTSTDNVKNACHPFSTRDHFKTNYILIHNGMITNSKWVKDDHEKLGIEYYSTQADKRFNDTEALSWDLALYLEGKQDKLETYGSIAFICLAINKKGKKLYFGRNSSPLFMSISKKRMILASVKGAAQTEVKPHTLYEFDYTTKKLTTKPLRIRAWLNDNVVETINERYTPPYTPPKSWVQTQIEEEDKNHQKLLAYNDEPYDDGMIFDDVYDSSLAEPRARDIKKTYNEYLSGKLGFYMPTIRELRVDIKDLEDQRYNVNDQTALDSLLNEISILRSVKDMFLVNPHYKMFNSRDPSYKDDKRLADVLDLV